MKTHPVALAVAASLVLTSYAGIPDKKAVTPMTELEPFGRITFGAKFSDDLQSGYADWMGSLYRTSNMAVYYNFRGTWADNDQQIFSAGVGFRYLIDGPGIIIGANAFYDYLDSSAGNSFSQLGLGAEVLTKWVDARFNYYLPESGREAVGHLTTVENDRKVSGQFTNGVLVQQQVVDRRTTSRFTIFEEALEGWNAEIGFLVPYVDNWFELRLFAGGYSYQDPKGGDISGFKARAEARVTEGLTFDVEYWEDEELVGGNWVAGVRLDVPFDINALFHGGNPFAGAGGLFGRRTPHAVKDRMDEMVIRSHRIQTGNSNPEPAGSTTTTKTQNVTVSKKTVMPPVTGAPSSGSGEGSPESKPEGEGRGEGSFQD